MAAATGTGLVIFMFTGGDSVRMEKGKITGGHYGVPGRMGCTPCTKEKGLEWFPAYSVGKQAGSTGEFFSQ